MMTGKNLKYLIGILNSNTFTFFFKNFYSGGLLGEKGYRYKKVYLEKVPIPVPDKKNLNLIEKNVDNIIKLSSKKNSSSHTKIKECEINIEKLVRSIYQLNDEEIKLINLNQ